MTRHVTGRGSARIAESVVAAMEAHARADAPNECCGLLIGTGDAVMEARAARNLRASPTRYLIHPGDHFQALRDARQRGLAVVGAYHSHPTSVAEPSETDRLEAVDPSFLYVIVSLAPGPGAAVRAFRLDAADQRSVEIAIERITESGLAGSP